MHTTLQVWTCDGCDDVVNIESVHNTDPPTTWSGITFALPGTDISDFRLEAKHFCGECTIRIVNAIPAPPEQRAADRTEPGPLTLLQLHQLGELYADDPPPAAVRPPSVADGTVSEALTETIRDLTDSFGAAGVRSILDELFGPEPPK